MINSNVKFENVYKKDFIGIIFNITFARGFKFQMQLDEIKN